MFKKMELVVTVDNMMTDTARWSDYVLPLAHWFEYEDAVIFGNTYHVLYSGKAADPLGESKCDLDIMRMLAEKMGLRDDLYPGSNEEYLRAYFDSEACAELGISYDALVEQHAIRCFPENFRMWDGGNFLTPSGRAEFYEKPMPSGYVSGARSGAGASAALVRAARPQLRQPAARHLPVRPHVRASALPRARPMGVQPHSARARSRAHGEDQSGRRRGQGA
ncbi:MAG: molybdopterin-dependent oxidoreductase [Eggerthellaceae bacterium]